MDSSPAEPQGKPKNIGVGTLSLLQRIFLTQESNQGSNPGLLHCRRVLHQLSHVCACKHHAGTHARTPSSDLKPHNTSFPRTLTQTQPPRQRPVPASARLASAQEGPGSSSPLTPPSRFYRIRVTRLSTAFFTEAPPCHSTAIPRSAPEGGGQGWVCPALHPLRVPNRQHVTGVSDTAAMRMSGVPRPAEGQGLSSQDPQRGLQRPHQQCSSALPHLPSTRRPTLPRTCE